VSTACNRCLSGQGTLTHARPPTPRISLCGLTQDSRAQAEASLQSQLAAQQVAGRELATRLEASQRQALKLEAEVASLQESSRQLTETRSGLEGGMLEGARKVPDGSARAPRGLHGWVAACACSMGGSMQRVATFVSSLLGACMHPTLPHTCPCSELRHPARS
jgi:hypothetical protein